MCNYLFENMVEQVQNTSLREKPELWPKVLTKSPQSSSKINRKQKYNIRRHTGEKMLFV